MKTNTFKAGAILLALLAPIGISTAYAQTTPAAPSASSGASGNNNGLEGTETQKHAALMDDTQAMAFRKYVMTKKHPSVSYKDKYAVDMEMKTDGMEMYDVPPEYVSGKYKYIQLNGEWVIIDPATHKIVQILK